jgi:hypothetical protein
MTDQGYVDLAKAERLELPARGQLQYRQHQAWLVRFKRTKYFAEGPRKGSGHASDRKLGGLSEKTHTIGDLVEILKELAGFLQEGSAGGRDLDSRGCADEQADTKLILKVAHLAAQRGLRNMQKESGASEAFTLGDSDKSA